MRHVVNTVVLLLVVVSTPLDAQRLAPTAVRRMVGPASVPLVLPDDRPRFEGERIVFGAALGALIVAPLGALYAQGTCEGADCHAWKRGLGGGAAIGAVLGGLFGLILALPARAD